MTSPETYPTIPDLADKVILITGASDGIGAEMARQLAATHRADVALSLAGRSREKLDQVAAQCSASGARS